LRTVVAAVTVVVILADALAATGRAQQVIPAPSAKVTPEQQEAIDAYATELKRFLMGQGMSMEPLLAAADRITHLLNFPVAPGERPRPHVDELAPDELRRIERPLTGISIHIGDFIDVSPDREYFLGQARLHGGPVDIEFFALLKRAYRPSGWPIEVERTSAESGCIDFTSGELVDLFWAWQRFRSVNPGRYDSATAKELARLEENLLTPDRSRCPQNPAMVERELRRLVELLPQHPIAAKIRQRLSGALRP